jgi:hypothetical protein
LAGNHPRWTRPFARAFVLSVALFALALMGCGEPVSQSVPRLALLYAPCTVNKDLLAPFNASITFTPNLGKLEKQLLRALGYIH